MSAGDPTPVEVRQHLDAILASQRFLNAARAQRFLVYVVEETLAGRTSGIKELVLGIQVFDRPPDFDPKADTIVRVEAGKLRKRLAEYYAGEGSTAALRIDIAKGAYVPRFLVSPTQPGEVTVNRSMSHRTWYAGA